MEMRGEGSGSGVFQGQGRLPSSHDTWERPPQQPSVEDVGLATHQWVLSHLRAMETAWAVSVCLTQTPRQTRAGYDVLVHNY